MSTRRPEVRSERGPRALEARLLADLAAECGRARAEPALLGRALWIVVPSHSLRAHLLARAVHANGAIAGVRVETLHGVAAGLLSRAGVARARGGLAFETVVARVLGDVPELARELGPSRSALTALTATLFDLFDAGFAPEHEEALHELLAEEARGRVRERTHALLRVAARTAAELARLGLERPSDDLRAAAEALVRRRADLSARAIWIHGFTDATGRASELLAALALGGRDVATRVYWDALAGDARAGFGAPLARRLELTPADEPADGSADTDVARGTIDLFSAPSRADEVRAAAERIRAELDRGARPESIGVVLRDPTPWRRALLRDCERLAIPVSGRVLRPALDGATRRLALVAELCANEGRMPLARWFELARSAGSRAARAIESELRLAFRQLGVRDLGALAELDLAVHLGRRTEIALSIRAPRDDGVDVEARAQAFVPRRVARDDLQREIDRARTALTGPDVRSRPPEPPPEPRRAELARRTLAEHLAALQSRLERADIALDGSREADGESGAGVLDDVRGALDAELGPAFALTNAEFADLFARAAAEQRDLADVAGGGIVVASVTEARARTFDHLFVLGLGQGSFPRSVREDPLLPDGLRVLFATLLVDLAPRQRGFQEERFLFEQLRRAAPRVTLSWHEQGDDGRVIAPSPFVEREVRELGLVQVPRAEALHARARVRSTALRPAHEHALLAGLWSPRADALAALEIALREREGGAAVDADRRRLADARAAALEARDPRHANPRLSPWSGVLGPARADDVRRGALYVTTLEQFARCPWQTFLTRLLRLAPPPDPEGTLPGLDARLVGSIVHAVLDELARKSLGAESSRANHADDARGGRGSGDSRELARLVAARDQAVHWPADKALFEIARTEAARLLLDEGLVLAGLAHLFAEQALPYLAVARELDRAGAGRVLQGETSDRVRIGAGADSRELRFVADRAERGAGGLELVDFKTGRALSTAKKEATRQKHLRTAIGRGEKLQAAVYARAAGPGGAGAYVFLAPEIATEARRVRASADDADLARELDAALSGLLRAWDDGLFFPRLFDDKVRDEPALCEHCEVAEVCTRSDSNERLRWRAWLEGKRAGLAREPGGAKIGVTPSPGAEHEPRGLGDELARTWFLGRDLAPKRGAGAEEDDA